MLYTPSGRITLDGVMLTDGTFILPGTNLTADGEPLFEFRDHLVPVYELTSQMHEKSEIGTYAVVNVALDCVNNADPGTEHKVLIDIPDGFTLVNYVSTAGTYSPNLGTWFVTLEDQTATLNLILEPITAGSGTFTVEVDGEDIISETEYEIVAVDTEGVIAGFAAALSTPPSSYTGVLGDGEDGSITGYSAVNNIVYTNSLPEGLAKCTDASYFNKNQGNETIGPFSSVEYAEIGTTSMAVQCPGVNDNEGTYITLSGLTVGETYTYVLAVYGFPDIRIALYIVDTDYYTTFVPDATIYEKRIVFTATATSHTISITSATKTSTVLGPAAMMLAEGDIGNAPIVMPGETGNTVRIQNIEEVTDQMRVVYTGFNYGMPFEDEDIDELVAIGATDVINLAYFNIMDDYSNKKAHIDEYATRFKEKGIRFHAAFAAFVHQGGSQEDPTNSTYVSSLISTITDLVTDCTDLAGISFDDFNYPTTYHVDANEATEELTLKNFITNVVTAVHGVRSTAKVSGALMPVPGEFGNNITYFTDEFDFSILMCTYRFYNNVSTFIRDKLEPILTLTGDNLVIPAVLTFHSDLTPTYYWSVEQIISDIYDIIDLNPEGFAIFDWLRHPEGLYCPVEDAKSGSNSIRIRTYGVTANEGVKLSVPDIQLKSLFNGILAVKALDNIGYKAGYGVSRLESQIGSGTWGEVDLNQTASEKYLYVVNEEIIGTVFHIDKFVFDLGLSVTYATLISNLKDGETYTIVTYSKVEETSVTGIHEGIRNNRIAVINGKEYLGSRVSIQNNIEKVICTFIYDETEDITIKWYYQYLSVTTSFTDRFLGLCINEGFNLEYSESQNLILNPEALFDRTGYSELTLPGASESAEYIFPIEIEGLDLKKFFSGIQILINSFAESDSGIQIQLISTSGAESKTKTTYINRTGEFDLGDMGDMWDLTDEDLQNETLEIHLKIRNTTLNSQSYSFSNLKPILYYSDNEIGDAQTVIYNNVHGKVYGLFMTNDANPEGASYDLETLKINMMDGELPIRFNIQNKELEFDFTVEGDTLQEARRKLRAIRSWFANVRNNMTIPTYNSLKFTYDESVEYFVIFKDVIEVETEISALLCTAKFQVPEGVARAVNNLVSGPVGQNPGEIRVWPLIEVRSDGSSSITISDMNTGLAMTLNTSVAANTPLLFDCATRTVTDKAGNHYTTNLGLNTAWINFMGKADYNISVSGGILQQVSFKPGY